MKLEDWKVIDEVNGLGDDEGGWNSDWLLPRCGTGRECDSAACGTI